MKVVPAIILSLGFLFTPLFCFGGEKLELKDLKDKESYSLGYQFGQNLKAQGLDIDLEVYNSGIQDALGGTKPLLSQTEMIKVVSGLQNRALMARQKESKEKADKNLAEGKLFLEENEKKGGSKDPSQRPPVQNSYGRFGQDAQSRR